MNTELIDQEIGEFQDDVRDLVIKLSGAPESTIDGKGSDAGWQEFTLAEIGQGFAFLKDKMEELERQNAELEACCADLQLQLESLNAAAYRDARIDDLERQNSALREALKACYCAIQGFKDTNNLAEDSVLNRARLSAKAALGF